MRENAGDEKSKTELDRVDSTFFTKLSIIIEQAKNANMRIIWIEFKFLENEYSNVF